jgi:3-oxoacyl-[acyl-carrier protein] reductase
VDLGLTGRVALVGGSSRGIGRAVARRLAREGARVIICARGREALERAAEEIRRDTQADVLALQADLLQPADVAGLVEEAVGRHGRLDVLVVNAGGPSYASDFVTVPLEAWDEAYQLVLRSAILLCRQAVPIMQRQRWGRIVLIGSVSAKQAMPGLLVSTVMRAGATGLSKGLAQELAPCGITVNAVCPGYIRTEKFLENAAARAARQGVPVDGVVAELATRIPAGRIGEPDELAAVVAFVASEPAGYLTGAMVQVDGGFVQAVM